MAGPKFDHQAALKQKEYERQCVERARATSPVQGWESSPRTATGECAQNQVRPMQSATQLVEKEFIQLDEALTELEKTLLPVLAPTAEGQYGQQACPTPPQAPMTAAMIQMASRIAGLRNRIVMLLGSIEL